MAVVPAMRVCGGAGDGCGRHHRGNERGAGHHRRCERVERSGRAPCGSRTPVQDLAQAFTDVGVAQTDERSRARPLRRGRLADHAGQRSAVALLAQRPAVGVAFEVERELAEASTAARHRAAERPEAYGQQHHETVPSGDVALFVRQSGGQLVVVQRRERSGPTRRSAGG
jgi:hypothetical protein